MNERTVAGGQSMAGRWALIICLVVPAVVLLASLPLGVRWLEPGDFGWREAMTYHGVLVPAWMLLVLASFDRLVEAATAARWRAMVARGATAAALLTGIGALLVRRQGLSAAAILQVVGMTAADLTALVVIFALIRSRKHGRALSCGVLWWSLVVALGAVSLATPLGHLAGACNDLGKRVPMLLVHARHLGLQPGEAVAGYIGSHGHQIVAAFVTAALLLPLAAGDRERAGWLGKVTAAGAAATLLASLGQVMLYQYSAWAGWEPPDLFTSGPNGIPLDDALLTILGIGLLFLMPALFSRPAGRAVTGAQLLDGPRLLAMAGLAFAVSMFGMGIYIELHEGFFGGGAAGAPGALNDLCYIRAHLVIGCMVLPLLMAAFDMMPHGLNGRATRLPWIAMAAILTAPVAVIVCTFLLSWTLVVVSVALTVLFLLLLAFVEVSYSRRSGRRVAGEER